MADYSDDGGNEAEFGADKTENEAEKRRLLDEDEVEAMLDDRDVDLERLATRRLGYGKNLYIDGTEEDKINEMPEIERENLLFERGEKRRELLETLRLKHQQKQAERSRLKAPPPPKPRSESDYDSDESFSKSKKKRRRSRYSDDDSDYSDKKRSKKSRKAKGSHEEDEEKVIDVENMKRCQISRTLLVKYVDDSFFDKFIGGFVRVGGGNEYKIYQISGVKTREKEYTVDGFTKTDLVLEGKHGKEKRDVLISVVSNQPLRTREFEHWTKKMEADNQEIMTQDEAQKYLEKLTKEVFNHVYTLQEVKEKVDRKKARRKKNLRLNYTVEISEVQRKIGYFETNDVADRDQKLEELREELRELQEQQKRLVEKRKRDSLKLTPGKINERNRQQNLREMEEIARQRAEQEKKEQEFNPYARQPCRPRTLWATSGPSEKKEAAKVEKKVVAAPTVSSTDQAEKERLELEMRLLKERQLQKSATVHDDVHIELSQSFGKLKPQPTGDRYVFVQKLNVQPKIFMSIEEYLKLQEKKTGA